MNRLFLQAISLVILLYSLIGCESKPVAVAYPERLDLYKLNEIKLDSGGIKRARQIWDSLKSDFIIDSTVRGYSYTSTLGLERPNKFDGFIRFDHDSLFGITDVRYTMVFDAPLKAPETYMYMGNVMVICAGKSEFLLENTSVYQDSLSIIVERGLEQFINREGVRIDTDRGVSYKPTAEQAIRIKNAMRALKAAYLLNSPLNKPQPY